MARYFEPGTPSIVQNTAVDLNYSPHVIFPDDELDTLIQSILALPPNQALVCLPGLSKYTTQILENKIKEILCNVPDGNFGNADAPDVPFTLDEDIALILSKRFNEPINGFFRHLIVQSRTSKSIQERMEYLNNTNCEGIVDDFVEQLLLEEFFEKDTLAIDDVPLPLPMRDEVNDSINELMQNLDFYIDRVFKNIDLAVFYSERFIFRMRKQRFIIGRSSKTLTVDLDLRYFFQPTSKHFSKIQAVVSILDDGNIYLENTGKLCIYINAVPVEKGQCAILPQGSILDFDGALIMFMANKSLIKELASTSVDKKKKKR